MCGVGALGLFAILCLSTFFLFESNQWKSITQLMKLMMMDLKSIAGSVS